MDDQQEVLDLSIVFTQPPPGSSPETLASVALQCDALGLRHTGEMLTDPLTKAEREDLLWYLEEYWQWPYLEFAARGKRIEALLDDVGRRFYHALFDGSEAQNILQMWQQHTNVQYQISIVSEIASILRLPWELLADSQGFLALHDHHPISIVRRIPKDEQQATLTTPFELPLRILLVTARPEDEGFVDPRSISHELVDELQRQSEAGTIELEFLRPPTFAALSARLKNTERPIHVLHFDGHGGLDDEAQQGILLFETNSGKPSPVKASDVAKVLSNSGVRLAVLTACQSAVNTEDDALSSVSTQLINNGMDAVIAMSSSILVTSAALYVEAFYHALAGGLPVSIAQEQARQALQKDPHRHLFSRRQDEEAAPVTLADWWVPHFYQQHPLTLHATTTPYKRPSHTVSTSARFNDFMPEDSPYQFSGRARELLQLERHLLRGKLVVLSGFGGVGKTTLVREAADWLTRTGLYTSACFVSFEHGGDASLLLSTLGTFLGIYDSNYTPNDPVAALAQLQPALDARPTLIIADNLESVLPQGEAPLERAVREQLWYVLPELARLGAGVLITTRDTTFGDDLLASSGQVAHLPLLGLKPHDAYALATRLLEKLGIPRIRAPYADLRDLLLQLDHHPLSIQLVLPTLNDCTLETILNDFAVHLSAFKDDKATGRNRSLLASLDYSLRQLTDAQRSWLPRLALFEGGASEDDLFAITQIPKDIWRELRPDLEQTALLTPEPVPGLMVPFLRFHPVLTPYLRSQFGTIEADPILRSRYSQRYWNVAGTLYRLDYQHPQAVRILAQKELPNLRRALTYLLESGDLKAASEIAGTIIRFLTIFGRWRERDALRQRMAEAVEHIAEQTVFTMAEYLQESGLGEDELKRGDLSTATARFTRLLAQIEAQPVGTHLSRGSYEHCLILDQLARALKSSGQPMAAEQYLRQALTVIDSLLQQQPELTSYQHQRSIVLTDLADVLTNQGQYAQARDVYIQTLALNHQLKDQRGQAVTEAQLGTLALEQRDYAEAKKRYLTALHTFQTLDEPLNEAVSWYQLGKLAQELNQWSEAERYYRASLAIDERLGKADSAAMACNSLAMVAEQAGRPEEAEGWYRRTLELDEQSQFGSPNASHLHNLASLLVTEFQAGHAASTHLAEAKHLAERALDIMQSRETSGEIWKTLDLLADIADLTGQAEVAYRYRRRAREASAASASNRNYLERLYGQLIMDIAAVARGHLAALLGIEAALPQLEANGWQIAVATRRIWAGERNWHSLVEGIDSDPALLILLVLETIAAAEETV